MHSRVLRFVGESLCLTSGGRHAGIGELRRFADYVLNHYGAYFIDCSDYGALLELMRHDKKNDSASVNFTLLEDVGTVDINCICDDEKIKMALDLYRDLMHI